MRQKYKDVALTVGMIIAFFVILSLWGFYWAIRPLKITTPITPAYFKLPFEKVEFQTQDKVTIRGWFIPNANPHAKAIILLHGYPADKGNILSSRLFLHKNFHLLFIDFRYLGESGGAYSTVGKNEVLDVLAAIQFLKQKGIHEIGIWGFSLGGAVALMTAPKAPEVKAIITESSYARLDKMAYAYFRIPLLKYPLGELLRLWGLIFLGYDIKKVSPMDSATSLNIPILIMHSKKDEVIPFENAKLLRKSLKNKHNVHFLIFDNLYHGEEPRDFQKIVEEFFDKNLGIVHQASQR